MYMYNYMYGVHLLASCAVSLYIHTFVAWETGMCACSVYILRVHSFVALGYLWVYSLGINSSGVVHSTPLTESVPC